MKVDTIITLDNGLEYALLERIELGGRIFFFAAGITAEEESTGEYIFVEELNRDGKTLIQLVNDEELVAKLSTIMTKEYLEASESIENE